MRGEKRVVVEIKACRSTSMLSVTVSGAQATKSKLSMYGQIAITNIK